MELGEFQRARDNLEEVVEARRRVLGLEHPSTLTAMHNLANTLRELGELQLARELGEEILDIQRRVLGPEHPGHWISVGNLASTLWALGEFQHAWELSEEVLETQRRVLGPEHPSTLAAMAELAGTLWALGEFQRAREIGAEVLEIRRRVLGPEHPDTLTSMANLAVTLRSLGEHQLAREMDEEILEIRRRVLGPEHPDTLSSMHNLAATLHYLKDLERARDLFEQLIEYRRKKYGPDYQPGTAEEVHNFIYLADTYKNIGKLEEAADLYLKTLDALDGQIDKLGMSDIKTTFKSKYETHYREAIKTFLALDRTGDAHHVLERFRAQGILDILADRNLTLPEIPPELDEQRRRLAYQYDATIRQRDQLHPVKDKEAYEAVLDRQYEIRRKRERLFSKIREKAPKGTGLSPLRTDEILQFLEPGTLILSYFVGPERTYLCTLSQDSHLEVHELDVGEDELRRQMERFFEQQQQSTTSTPFGNSRSAMGSWLYNKLFKIVAKKAEKSQRLLIVPDGPLSYLPFSALVRPDGKYLAQSTQAIYTAASATVYVELQKRRRPVKSADDESPMKVVAFGDPKYPKGNLAPNGIVRSAVKRGIFNGGLQPLPHTGREVAEIGKIYPAARIFIKNDAKEEAAKALGEDVRILHIAAHGVSDDHTPLDSFVALTVPDVTEDANPGADNGLLQAWEIFENLRIDADLVVLSACRTAFGREHDGEGLMSLSRAFLAAGARTVIASLWSVNDASTAELMIRFYRHYHAGKSKAEALRAAQLEFIEGPIEIIEKGKLVKKDYSSPYYWAAFQVIGDWK